MINGEIKMSEDSELYPNKTDTISEQELYPNKTDTISEQELTPRMAKVGYEGYAAHIENITRSNLPKWDELPDAVKCAWIASANEMIEFLANIGPVTVREKSDDVQ